MMQAKEGTMPHEDYLSASPQAGLWQSTAKQRVLESLRRSQYLTMQRWRSQWQALHAMYDGEFAALMRDRIKITHPERAKEWSNQDAGLRYVHLVRAWVERLSVVFHRPPETFLHAGDGVPLSEDHPAVKQWRRDSKQIRLNETLSQIEAWTNLMGQAIVQPAWVKGSEMRLLVHAPYEVWIDQDSELPSEIDGASITVNVRQPLDSVGINPVNVYATWQKEHDGWHMWVHDDRGALRANPLFPDNVSRYERNGSGHPFVVFRREQPAPGGVFVPPDEALIQLAMASNLKLMDIDYVNRYQCHSQAVIVGHTVDEMPTMGPSRVLHFPDRDSSFEFVSPSPNLAELRESFNFDLRLAAVSVGMAPDTFEPQSSTRNLASKQLENYQLRLKRERAIPAYLHSIDKLWESIKMVGDYWAGAGGERVRYGDLELGVNLAGIPEVFDRFQDVQATIQELGSQLTSPVEVTMRREGVTRQEALRRVAERTTDTIGAKRMAADESGSTEQVVEVATESVLNGAQVVAAAGIVEKVAAGLLPRDSGLGMIEILFNLQSAQSLRIMGSAGTSTFEPPAEDAAAPTAVTPPSAPPAPPTKAAAGDGVPRPPSVRAGD